MALVAAVVAAGTSFGTTTMPTAATMMIDTPMMLHQKPESAEWPRRVRLLRRRGPVPSVLFPPKFRL